MITSTPLNAASPEEIGHEGMLFYLVSGAREAIRECASVAFHNNRLICRDDKGNDLRSYATSELAFVTRGTVSPGIPVWI